MYTKYDNMTKDTTTIRIAKETKKILETFGNFGDNYDDCIQNLHNEYKTQKDTIYTMKKKYTELQKKQSKHNKKLK